MFNQTPGRINTLRFQAYVTIGLTLLSIAAIYILILYFFEKERRKTVVKKIESNIHAIIEQRQQLIANELYLDHQEAVRLIIDRLLKIDSVSGIIVFREDGSIFAAGGSMPLRNLSEMERSAFSESHHFYVEGSDDQAVAIYSIPILVIGETLGYVKVYYSLADVLRESRWTILIFSMLLLTILLAMAIALHTFLTRSVIRPVGLIIDVMRSVKEGSLGQQVSLSVSNEIGEMAHTFNQMSLEKARIYQELTELNRHLEQKIAGNTKELKRKRITLRATLERLRNTQDELLAQSDQLDIARREAESAKRHAEAASQAKSEFISHMNHELRTPLNGIMGYAQILRREKALTHDQREGLYQISQSSQHLLTLINDILDLSRIEARRLELLPTECRFKIFLDEIAHIIQMKATQKGVAFLCDIHRNALPSGVRIDEKRLRQVLLNLLGNAVKYTQMGQVVFRVYPSTPSDADDMRPPGTTERRRPTMPVIPDTVTSSDHVTIRFEVDDTGPGIAPDQLGKIFLPFEQAGHSAAHSTGTGLGLAISHRLVKLMQSHIHVKSEIGKGSRFWFDLKLVTVGLQNEDAGARSSAISGYKGKRRTLLIIDDNATTCSMMSNLLEPIGFQCLQARDGEHALAMLQQALPDAVLVDLVLPGMSGVDIVREIRKRSHGKDLTVIAISANTFKEHQQESMVAGCDAFLPKPVKADLLFQLLARHLQLQWTYDPSDQHVTSNGTDSHLHEEPPLIPLPQAEMEALFEMAKMGDMRSLQDRARRMDIQDSPYGPFARKLYHLSRNYQDKQILALFEQYMDSGL